MKLDSLLHSHPVCLHLNTFLRGNVLNHISSSLSLVYEKKSSLFIRIFSLLSIVCQLPGGRTNDNNWIPPVSNFARDLKKKGGYSMSWRTQEPRKNASIQKRSLIKNFGFGFEHPRSLLTINSDISNSVRSEQSWNLCHCHCCYCLRAPLQF